MGDDITTGELRAEMQRLRSHVESALGGPDNPRGSIHTALDEVRGDLKRVLKRLHGDPDADDAPPGVVQRLKTSEDRAERSYTAIEITSGEGKLGLKARVSALEKTLALMIKVQIGIAAMVGAAVVKAVIGLIGLN